MEKSIYSFIWRYSKSRQIIISLITIASFPFIYVSLLLPKIIVNDAIEGKDFPKAVLGFQFEQQTYLIGLCVVLLLLYLINGGFLMLLNTYKNSMSERMIRRLRYMLYERVLRFPLPHFEKVSQGELSAMIAGEVELIREFISDAIALPLFQGGTLLVILFFMFSQDPILGAAALVLIPVQAYITPKIQRRINLLGKERVERARRLSGRVSESVSGIRDIRSNDTHQFALADYSQHLDGIYKVRYRIFEIKFFMKFLNNLLLKLTPLMFYAIGGILIINGRLSLGALVAVLAAYSQLTQPWKELLRYYQRRGDAIIKYQQLVSAFELDTLLDQQLLNPTPASSDELPDAGKYTMENVTAVLDDGNRTVDDLSIQLEPGQKLAVISDAASRQSFANIAAGLESPDSGQVQLGGLQLLRMSARQRAASIGYIGPDSYVFEGTIGYNSHYALQRRLPKEVKSPEFDVAEAELSGNSTYDASADWTDLELASIDTDDELDKRWLKIVEAVELKEFLFQRALRQVLKHPPSEEFERAILTARDKLNANASLEDMFHPLDYETYNRVSSVADNILFGTSEIYQLDRFGAYPAIREALKAAGIEHQFIQIGLDLTKRLIELFGDADTDNSLLRRFRFVSSATLETVTDIRARAQLVGIDGLKKEDISELISLTCQLVVERHRLGFIDEELQKKIVKARHHFHRNLSPEEREGISVISREKFNPSIPLRANLIMGRVSLERANAEERVTQAIKSVARELNIEDNIIQTARDIDVGIGGQRIPMAARQSLSLTRVLMKAPHVLVFHDGLSAHDRESQDRIRSNIMKLFPQMTLIWVDSEMPRADDFDSVITLRAGRASPRLSVPGEPDAQAQPKVQELGTLDAEATALSHVALFDGIAPANLKMLAFGSRRVSFKPGEYLAREGEIGNTAYLILSGEVDVVLKTGATETTRIATLDQFELFGETALLATIPRTASGIAIGDVEALEIDKEIFLTLMENDARVATNVARQASQRLASALGKIEEAA